MTLRDRIVLRMDAARHAHVIAGHHLDAALHGALLAYETVLADLDMTLAALAANEVAPVNVAEAVPATVKPGLTIPPVPATIKPVVKVAPPLLPPSPASAAEIAKRAARNLYWSPERRKAQSERMATISAMKKAPPPQDGQMEEILNLLAGGMTVEDILNDKALSPMLVQTAAKEWRCRMKV